MNQFYFRPRRLSISCGVLALLVVGLQPARAVELPAEAWRGATVYLPEVPGSAGVGGPEDPALAPERVLGDAARDLVDYVKRMTGVDLKVARVKDAASIPVDAWSIVLDSLARSSGLKVPATEYGLDGLAYDVHGKQLRLAGETPLATAYATADFLERQGVRWYTPGPYGEIVPARKTLNLPDAPVRQTPSMLFRRPWYDGGSPAAYSELDWQQFLEWNRRNKSMGGFNADNGHMWEQVLAANGGRQKLFAEHPDWFGEVDGKRVPGQLCMTNPQVVQLFVDYYRKRLAGQPRDTRAIFSICPDDGLIYCTCANCRKFIFQPDVVLPSVPDTSDLVFHFCNEVVARLNQDYPNVSVCTYVYANFQVGPQKEKVNPHVVGMFAPLSFDRYHALGDPRSPSRILLAKSVERFVAGGAKLGWYDYSFLCPDCMMPFTRLPMVRHDLPWLYDHGLRYWTIETQKNWPNYLPDYYLTAKLTWDVHLDQDRLLDEFYRQYFGAAASEMRAYLDELVNAYTALTFTAGNKEFMGSVFTPERLAKLQAIMKRATAAAAADPATAHRVRMFALPLELADRFMAMRAATCRFDFAAAQRVNEQIQKWFDDAMAFDSLTTCKFTRDSWYAPYYGNNVKQVADWTRGATILTKFPDEWPAFLDPKAEAAPRGALAADASLYAKRQLKTYSACLAEQGLDTFRGAIWYRQTFATPTIPAGQKAYLLVAGLDDTLTAWIDGQEIGKQTSGSFGTALLELPALNPKLKEHTLTIKVTNNGLTELGTGGIIRPVCLIARQP